MRIEETEKLLEEYRVSCNFLTNRIEALNDSIRLEKNPARCDDMCRRVRLLREERLELLRTMESLRGYVL